MIGFGLPMSEFESSGLMRIYTALRGHFGDPNWWPGDTEFEICIGAILTQNTFWKNVETAIDRLRENGLLDPGEILQAEKAEITQSIKPAGYYNQKAEYLINFCYEFMNRWEGDFNLMASDPKEETRRGLLSIRGIGPETADSILCYCLNKPIFVVDAYTKRIFHRLDPNSYNGIISIGGSAYSSISHMVMDNCSGDHLFYNRFHALLVLLGKGYCRRKPLCESCPLRSFCGFFKR